MEVKIFWRLNFWVHLNFREVKFLGRSNLWGGFILVRPTCLGGYMFGEGPKYWGCQKYGEIIILGRLNFLEGQMSREVKHSER